MLESLIDRFGDGAVLAMAGALVGVLFGAAAQHSRFCLRAAAVEVAERGFGPRLSIWLIAFSAGVASVQGAIDVIHALLRRKEIHLSDRAGLSPANVDLRGGTVLQCVATLMQLRFTK